MKIVLVNYRYFMSGGPERYMFNIMALLERNGHEVIPFSVMHNKNVPSPYNEYFISPIGTGNEIYGHEYKKDIGTVFKVCSRIIYSFEAKRKLKVLLKKVNPDLVYILHFQNKMSCSVVDAAKELGIPVVQRISDFGHICQNLTSSFYDSKTGQICEKCLKGSALNNVLNRCVQGSYLKSAIKTSSLLLMSFLKIKEKIDAFVFPSAFTMSKYIEFGVIERKGFCIPTYFNRALIRDFDIQYKNYAVFVGRIVPEKGVKTLIDAFIDTPFSLKVIGYSSDGSFEDELKMYLRDKIHNIEFLGAQDFEQIQRSLSSCLFSIVPSEWYDNLPNTILESYAFKKCVVATNIGSLKEAVIDGETGLLFEYKNPASLREKITQLFSNPHLAVQYGLNSFKKIETVYSEEAHYAGLVSVFEEAISKGSSKSKSGLST